MQQSVQSAAAVGAGLLAQQIPDDGSICNSTLFISIQPSDNSGVHTTAT